MRIALGLAYDGSRFEGWQSQPSGNTVQDALERALAVIAGVPVRVAGAGRTDTGVHASAQVAHFDVAAERPESAWVRGTNTGLPEGVVVHWARCVSDEFNARFAARGRTYTYVLQNTPVRPALFARQVGWFHLPLAIEPMRAAAAHLVGTHDFTSFRSSECQAKMPVREMRRIAIESRGPYVVFTLEADAFLHHMVRNIVGALVYVGKGKHRPEWLAELLAMRDRTRAAPTFGPAGLYLTRVAYDAHWGLPEAPPLLPWTDRPWSDL